ncbi:hypothetical protein DL98DRAFT_616663 [Cadophora sp. DSE1049]|nr:hypothetical protein DL98DRAFT_616663 [Cadophora sp. DSE1049]
MGEGQSKRVLASPNIHPSSNPLNQASLSSRSFTCFPRLPLELRRKIWKVVAVSPKFLEVQAHFVRYCEDTGKIYGDWYLALGSSPYDLSKYPSILRFRAVPEDEILFVTLASSLTCCREAYDEITRLLPNRLPSLSDKHAIRFDASKTAVLVCNFGHMLRSLSKLNFGPECPLTDSRAANRLSTKSFLGNNVKKLVVDGYQIGRVRQEGWHGAFWKALLGNFFQTLDEIAVTSQATRQVLDLFLRAAMVDMAKT